MGKDLESGDGGSGDAPMILSTAVAVKLLGSEMSRKMLWALAAASSILLVGPSAVLNTSTCDECVALLIFGCVGLGLGLLCMALETTSSSILDSQAVIALLGFIFTGCGIASMLTLVIGTVETVSLAFGAIGLSLAGFALIGTEINAIKSRLSTAAHGVRNGANAVALVLSLIIYVVVASVALNKYPEGTTQNIGYDLAVSGVAIGVLCLVASLAGLFFGGRLGSKEKYFYMVMTLVLLIGASVFPMGAILATKQISASVTLLSAVAFSALITRNLFHNTV